MSWLQARQPVVGLAEANIDAIDRATATDPQDLPKQQAAVAFWLSKKYRVAAEPLGLLVAEAYELGARTKLDPTLILAIVAIESSESSESSESMITASCSPARARPRRRWSS